MLSLKRIWPENTFKALYFVDNRPSFGWILDYGMYMFDEFSAWRKQSANIHDISFEEMISHFDLNKKKFNWIEDS